MEIWETVHKEVIHISLADPDILTNLISGRHPCACIGRTAPHGSIDESMSVNTPLIPLCMMPEDTVKLRSRDSVLLFVP